MKAATRVHKGRRQVLFEGVWCDIPHGYHMRTLTEEMRKRKLVVDAKKVLGDEPEPRRLTVDISIDEMRRHLQKMYPGVV